jgi:hypothetical protein
VTFTPPTSLYSTAPFLFTALLNLCTAAAALQNPYVYVAAFDLLQYEPSQYCILQGIANHRLDIETLGPTRSMVENYDLYGYVSVFTGDTPDAISSPTVATNVMDQTYALFSNVVLTPAMSNSNAPVFGAQSPFLNPGAVNKMWPSRIQYSAGSAFEDDGAPTGWMGRIDWAISLSAFVSPTQTTQVVA